MLNEQHEGCVKGNMHILEEKGNAHGKRRVFKIPTVSLILDLSKPTMACYSLNLHKSFIIVPVCEEQR